MNTKEPGSSSKTPLPYLAHLALLDHGLYFFLFPGLDGGCVAHHAPEMVDTKSSDSQKNASVYKNVDNHEYDLDFGWAVCPILKGCSPEVVRREATLAAAVNNGSKATLCIYHVVSLIFDSIHDPPDQEDHTG